MYLLKFATVSTCTTGQNQTFTLCILCNFKLQINFNLEWKDNHDTMHIILKGQLYFTKVVVTILKSLKIDSGSPLVKQKGVKNQIKILLIN